MLTRFRISRVSAAHRNLSAQEIAGDSRVVIGESLHLGSSHPGGNPVANLKSISHRCYLFEVAFVWELTEETIDLPLGCLQGGPFSRC